MDELTEFKRGVMNALIDDDNCLKKLGDIHAKLGLQAFMHEEKALKRREEQKQVEELISYLTNKDPGI